MQIPDTDIELCMTEQEMLASFWRVHAGVNKVQKELIATFNGRKFAIPFLYVRSSVQGVPIGSPDLPVSYTHLSKVEPQYLIKKRHDRPHGHAQGIGAQETQEQTMSAPRIEKLPIA